MIQAAKTLAQQARGRALLFGLEPSEAVEQNVSLSSENMSILNAEILRAPALDALAGLGPLQTLLDDPTVEEFWINQPDEIWYADSQGSHRLVTQISPFEIESYVSRMLRDSSRRLDRSNPFVDATLMDGSRLHVVIPNITKRHWSVSVRKFRAQNPTLGWLVASQSMTAEQSEKILTAVSNGTSIVVSGATQAGKTTILTALLNSLGPSERLVSAEDTFELSCNVADWVAMQTRDGTSESNATIDLRRLVRETLRMRPTRIAIGEVRGAEALDLLLALNSGIPGFCTIHANSARHALQKLESLPLLAAHNLSVDFVRELVVSNIGLIVHCERLASGSRRVTEILEVENV